MKKVRKNAKIRIQYNQVQHHNLGLHYSSMYHKKDAGLIWVLINLLCELRCGCWVSAALGDNLYKIICQHKWNSFSLEAIFPLCMVCDVSKVDMEYL